MTAKHKAKRFARAKARLRYWFSRWLGGTS
jgi:hypothetical protein